MTVLLLKSTEATRPPAFRCQNRANGLEQPISGDARCEASSVWSGCYGLPSCFAASFRNVSECSCRSFLSSRSTSAHSGSDALRAFAHNSRIRSCRNNGEGISRVCSVTTVTVHTICGVSHKTDNILQSVRTKLQDLKK